MLEHLGFSSNGVGGGYGGIVDRTSRQLTLLLEVEDVRALVSGLETEVRVLKEELEILEIEMENGRGSLRTVERELVRNKETTVDLKTKLKALEPPKKPPVMTPKRKEEKEEVKKKEVKVQFGAKDIRPYVSVEVRSQA